MTAALMVVIPAAHVVAVVFAVMLSITIVVAIVLAVSIAVAVSVSMPLSLGQRHAGKRKEHGRRRTQPTFREHSILLHPAKRSYEAGTSGAGYGRGRSAIGRGLIPWQHGVKTLASTTSA